MQIPDYDSDGDNDKRFKQLYPNMPRYFSNVNLWKHWKW